MRRVVAMLLCLGSLLPALSAQAAHAERIFYQPQTRDAGVAVEQWDELFRQLRADGYGGLVLQWTSYDGHDFGGPEGWLGQVAVRALASGLELHVGLAWSTEWFTDLESTSPAWPVRLHLLLQESLEQARRWRVLREHGGFTGWYLPLELPDRHLEDPQRQAALQEQLERLHNAVQAPLAVSSYFTGYQTPAAYAAWLARLAAATGVEVWVQDGAGVGRLSAAERAPYLRALDCSVGVIREAFVQLSDDEEMFRGAPRAPDGASPRDCHSPLVFSLRYLPQARGVLAY